MRRTFVGGVHPSDMKQLSNGKPIEEVPAPQLVRIPMSQHLGAPCKPVVDVGDTVRKGQVVGEAGGFVSAPVHSPVSGNVTKLAPFPHIFGSPVLSAVIENDGNDNWAEGLNEETDRFLEMPKDKMKERIQKAGIVGMGGATFPTHVKLSPPPEKPIDSFILNGVECEPYLTADHRLMLENPEEIVQGLQILSHIVGANDKYIAIEKNKPDAIEIMRTVAAKIDTEIEVVPLEVKYPQGAEKQLIKAILDREVPSGGLPMDVGALVNNVGTANAVYEAIRFNRPCISRVLTVTGNGVEEPKNLRALVGTLLDDVLKIAGLKETMNKLILGGPMMGLAQFTTDLVVTKGTSGVLLLEDAREFESGPCIRCGNCIDSCPTYLVPSVISIHLEAKNVEAALENGLLDCIECGVCAYVCPAKRPIVQLIKYGKAQARALKAKKA